MNSLISKLNFAKQIIILCASWSMIYSPIALANDTTPPVEPPVVEAKDNPDYCYEGNKSPQSCSDNMVYSCHLEECVSTTDKKDYDLEYLNCNDDSCREELKSDAKEFTQHDPEKLSNAEDDAQTYAYLSAASQIGLGCTIIFGCDFDSYGAFFAGIVLMSTVVMSAMGDGYSDKFDGYKQQLKQIEEQNKEKGWNHRTQALSLEMEIQMLKDMKKAAEDKEGHHQTVMALVTIVGVLAALCVTFTWGGCTATNPCAIPLIALTAVAVVLEQQAMGIAKDAAKDAQDALVVAQDIYDKLIKRYNNQAAEVGPGAQQSTNVNVNAGSQTIGVNSADQTAQTDEQSTVTEMGLPEFEINIGELGGTGQNYTETIGYDEIVKGYNDTNSNNDPSYISNAVGSNAVKISKASRKVLEALSKSDKFPSTSKKDVNALLNPRGNLPYLNRQFRKNVSPIQAMLKARKVSGTSVNKLASANKKKKSKAKAAIAYDSSTADYLKKLQDQLKDFENLVETPVGVEAMQNYDPTASDEVAKQINGKDNTRKVVHPDSGVSLWRIITNRYNVLRLKKEF